MSEFAQHILKSLISAPAFGLGALLLLYALYRTARHEILLFGTVRNIPGPENTSRFSYSFFIQNLE